MLSVGWKLEPVELRESRGGSVRGKEVKRHPGASLRAFYLFCSFPDNFEKLSPPILQLDELEFYYTPQQRLFSGLCVSADLDSRICIVGDRVSV